MGRKKNPTKELLMKWAETAWMANDGDWDKAKADFCNVRDLELPKLTADEIRDAQAVVWQFYGNYLMSTISSSLRGEARDVSVPAKIPPKGTPAVVSLPTGANSRRTKEAMDLNAETQVKLFMDTFRFSTSRVLCRKGNYGQLCAEISMRDKRAATEGRDTAILKALKARMEARGKTKYEDLIEDSCKDRFVEGVRREVYAK
jgi:hypothetical protein